VVAPEAVSLWIPTFHEHPYPAQLRDYLTGRILVHLGRESVRMRLAITEYVDMYEAKMDADGFRNALRKLEIEGVCLLKSSRRREARIVLREEGYDKVERIGAYEIWSRSPPTRSER
jgi:hypothetical protein